MGSARGVAVRHEPCANCGERPGYMSNSRWNIGDAMVCSRACGIRLHKKIENGMHPPIPGTGPFSGANHRHCEKRIRRLRNRIKVLENRLRHPTEEDARE